MNVLMIAHFCGKLDGGNNRFLYLAKLLSKDNDVELITSDFFHEFKKHRNQSADSHSLPYKVTMLHESGYPKNVCLKRLSSHKEFAKNLAKYLEKREKPDVVYCAVPSLDAAKTAAKYCQKNDVRFIVDVQDLWPEAFQMVFNVPVLSNILFSPMARKANYAYAAADEVIAVSKTYVNRAIRVNKKCKNPLVVYLGTDKDYFDECAAAAAPTSNDELLTRLIDNLKNGDGKIRLAYIGTLGSSYDLTTVFSAMRKLDKSILDNIEFVVMGDGPKRSEFEASAVGLPVVFTGNLAYPEMVWILTRCNIAINPIKKGAAASIINKHMDYAMAGLPVISTQESEEYRSLVEEYCCGINCECENADEVAAAITELCTDRDKAVELGRNSRRMGEELFDRKQAYQKIADAICVTTEEKR
ncbi:MAG: glycosyltransferase family 4 protein [Clostridiales bacterium]|nr:glycosyltransferase family 4 protein [Clostridiales bacterium]